MAAGAAEIGREAAIAALTGGAGNVALKAGRWAAAARGVYAAGQVYNGVQVGQGLYAAAGAFAQGNVLQGVLLAVTSGVGLPGPRIVGPGLQRGVASGPLDWSRVNWKGETAWEHVQRHGQAAPNRKLHGTFTDDAVLTTEEAWSRAQRLGMSPHIEGNGAGVLSVPMGRAIGRETGWGQAGRPTSRVRIVLEGGTNRIITSFPEY